MYIAMQRAQEAATKAAKLWEQVCWARTWAPSAVAKAVQASHDAVDAAEWAAKEMERAAKEEEIRWAAAVEAAWAASEEERATE